MVSLMVLYNCVNQQYGAETIFMRRVTGQLVFFQVISYRGRRFLCKNFSSPPAMSYDKFCSVPGNNFCLRTGSC